MSQAQSIAQVFTTPDGQTFDTKAEALDHLRRPKILAEMEKITGNNSELSEWLVDNQDEVMAAFDAGTIRRVTKSEKNKLTKAVDAIVESVADNAELSKKIAFFLEHKDVVIDSFRWPKVKRMKDEEKETLAKNTLMKASDNQTDLVDWVMANQEKVLAAYDAGKEKREVSPKATAGLNAYREARKAEKEAKEAGKSVEEQKAVFEETMARLKAA